MAIDLTSRDYLKGLKWNIKPKNIVDTVNSSIYAGIQKGKVVDVHEFTSITIGEEVKSLPLSIKDTSYTHAYSMYNIDPSQSDSNPKGSTFLNAAGIEESSRAAFQTDKPVMGAGVVQFTLLQGEYNIVFEEPPAGELSVAVSIEGDTYSADWKDPYPNLTVSMTGPTGRPAFIKDMVDDPQALKNLYMDVYRMYDNEREPDINNPSANADAYYKRAIVNNRSVTPDGHILIDYNRNRLMLTPWLRNEPQFYNIYGSMQDYPDSTDRPLSEDVYCNWYDPDFWRVYPRYEFWSTYINEYANNRQGPDLWPADPTYSETQRKIMENSFIPLENKYVSIGCTLEQVDAVTYKVRYAIPVRYVQTLAVEFSRNTSGGPAGYISYVGTAYKWMDMVSKVTITTTSTIFDRTVMDKSYGLDADGNLTTDVTNRYPLRFDESDLLTKDVTWNDQLWPEAMSKYLLQKFGKGKYVISCTVKASWILKNNIHVNSEVNIKTLGGQYVQTSSGTAKATFQVKNIKKIFNGSEFVYDIQLLEV